MESRKSFTVPPGCEYRRKSFVVDYEKRFGDYERRFGPRELEPVLFAARHRSEIGDQVRYERPLVILCCSVAAR